MSNYKKLTSDNLNITFNSYKQLIIIFNFIYSEKQINFYINNHLKLPLSKQKKKIKKNKTKIPL